MDKPEAPKWQDIRERMGEETPEQRRTLMLQHRFNQTFGRAKTAIAHLQKFAKGESKLDLLRDEQGLANLKIEIQKGLFHEQTKLNNWLGRKTEELERKYGKKMEQARRSARVDLDTLGHWNVLDALSKSQLDPELSKKIESKLSSIRTYRSKLGPTIQAIPDSIHAQAPEFKQTWQRMLIEHDQYITRELQKLSRGSPEYDQAFTDSLDDVERYYIAMESNMEGGIRELNVTEADVAQLQNLARFRPRMKPDQYPILEKVFVDYRNTRDTVGVLNYGTRTRMWFDSIVHKIKGGEALNEEDKTKRPNYKEEIDGTIEEMETLLSKEGSMTPREVYQKLKSFTAELKKKNNALLFDIDRAVYETVKERTEKALKTNVGPGRYDDSWTFEQRYEPPALTHTAVISELVYLTHLASHTDNLPKEWATLLKNFPDHRIPFHALDKNGETRLENSIPLTPNQHRALTRLNLPGITVQSFQTPYGKTLVAIEQDVPTTLHILGTRLKELATAQGHKVLHTELENVYHPRLPEQEFQEEHTISVEKVKKKRTYITLKPGIPFLITDVPIPPLTKNNPLNKEKVTMNGREEHAAVIFKSDSPLLRSTIPRGGNIQLPDDIWDSSFAQDRFRVLSPDDRTAQVGKPPADPKLKSIVSSPNGENVEVYIRRYGTNIELEAIGGTVELGIYKDKALKIDPRYIQAEADDPSTRISEQEALLVINEVAQKLPKDRRKQFEEKRKEIYEKHDNTREVVDKTLEELEKTCKTVGGGGLDNFFGPAQEPKKEIQSQIESFLIAANNPNLGKNVIHKPAYHPKHQAKTPMQTSGSRLPRKSGETEADILSDTENIESLENVEGQFQITPPLPDGTFVATSVFTSYDRESGLWSREDQTKRITDSRKYEEREVPEEADKHTCNGWAQEEITLPQPMTGVGYRYLPSTLEFSVAPGQEGPLPNVESFTMDRYGFAHLKFSNDTIVAYSVDFFKDPQFKVGDVLPEESKKMMDRSKLTRQSQTLLEGLEQDAGMTTIEKMSAIQHYFLNPDTTPPWRYTCDPAYNLIYESQEGKNKVELMDIYRAGDCKTYVTEASAFGRDIGIPVRKINGYTIYNNDKDQSIVSDARAHTINQFYVEEDTRWITLDATAIEGIPEGEVAPSPPRKQRKTRSSFDPKDFLVAGREPNMSAIQEMKDVSEKLAVWEVSPTNKDVLEMKKNSGFMSHLSMAARSYIELTHGLETYSIDKGYNDILTVEKKIDGTIGKVAVPQELGTLPNAITTVINGVAGKRFNLLEILRLEVGMRKAVNSLVQGAKIVELCEANDSVNDRFYPTEKHEDGTFSIASSKAGYIATKKEKEAFVQVLGTSSLFPKLHVDPESGEMTNVSIKIGGKTKAIPEELQKKLTELVKDVPFNRSRAELSYNRIIAEIKSFVKKKSSERAKDQEDHPYRYGAQFGLDTRTASNYGISFDGKSTEGTIKTLPEDMDTEGLAGSPESKSPSS